VIAAHSDVLAGVKLRAALADQYASCGYDLAAIAFDSETLGFRVASIAGTPACFLVCHFVLRN